VIISETTLIKLLVEVNLLMMIAYIIHLMFDVCHTSIDPEVVDDQEKKELPR
jgi:hypothetical protein